MFENVAVSWMMGDPDLIKWLTADIVAAPETNAKAVEAMGLLKAGKPVPKDLCPTKIWGDNGKGKVGKLPALFDANGYYIVSGEAASILRQFDLGAGALYPVKIFEADAETEVAGDWHCWIFGNIKECFVSSEARAGKPVIPGDDGWWSMPLPTKDDDLAVNAGAFEGPDVWVDPGLFKSVFLSAALSDALSDAGLAKAFRLARCRTV